MSSFHDFGLPDVLIKALERMSFSTPTPVQEQAIPLALKGRDVLGSSQTGTGKTGAFAIPLLAHLLAHPESSALVLTPTRELATQVLASIKLMMPAAPLHAALLIGGDSMSRQLFQLAKRPRLIVGTPGRINDHLKRRSLNLGNVGYLVMDEADRMLDMGFGVQIETIIQKVPETHQTLMFSATFSKPILKLSEKYLNNPARIAIGSTHTPLENIQQETIRTDSEKKYTHLLAELNVRDGSVIIFVKTKHGTERLAEKLKKANHAVSAIHGDLRQRMRDRVIRSFREKEYRILVATDVAARGLDIPHIEHVINYDLPQCPEDYIHRIGRTARAGAEGCAVNLIGPEDREKWSAIERLIMGKSSNLNESRTKSPKTSGRGRSADAGGFKKKSHGRFLKSRSAR